MHYRQAIEDFQPANRQESEDKDSVQQYLHQFPDLLTRENRLLHFTSSGLVVNFRLDRILMVHHNQYNTWTWPGGHVDGESDFLQVALREVREETGLKNILVNNPEIHSLDILAVRSHWKKGKYVPSHLHLSIGYLFQADDQQLLRVETSENRDVAWIPIRDLHKVCQEPHMEYIYLKILTRAKILS